MNTNQIELLNGSNYKKWKGDVELSLGILDYHHVLQEDPSAPLAAKSSKDAKDKFHNGHKHNKMELILMKKSMS